MDINSEVEYKKTITVTCRGGVRGFTANLHYNNVYLILTNKKKYLRAAEGPSHLYVRKKT